MAGILPILQSINQSINHYAILLKSTLTIKMLICSEYDHVRKNKLLIVSVNSENEFIYREHNNYQLT